ncbi:Protein KRTCAP2-like protein [Trichoplax sp. H2]|nr:Protein KRTCAP2-like protein [Trichoplax sp. H2]|eukprot:RDD43722.1 Protein KRTCAP2-like protein [Trichoplax sp. H2]
MTWLIKGAVSPSSSCAVAAILSVVIFTGMQTFRTQLASSREMTILGGFIGSELFIFILTVSDH